MKSKIKYITYTAVMLALTAAVQSIRTLIPSLSALSIFGPFNVSTLIIGALVNLILFVTTWKVGLASGLTVSVLSTLLAFLQGFLPIPHMIPVVAVGNAVLVLVIWLMREKNGVLSIAVAAVAKCAVLWAMVAWIIVPVLSSNEAMAKVIKALSVNFSWPQLVTALIGGSVAGIIRKRIK